MSKSILHTAALRTLLIYGFSLGFAVNLPARTMYLSTTGDDSSPVQAGAEFRTLNRALNSLVAGDTLIIRNGTYQGGLIVSLKGTAEAPIMIQGESLEAVIQGSVNKLDAVRLDSSRYVYVDRITAKNADRGGLGIIHCHHITVTNGRFADNGLWGIFTGYADDVRFEGNECYGSKEQHGIYHSNSGDRFIIRGNLVHNNSGCGIHMNGDPEMPGGDGVLNMGLVEDNIIYDNGQPGGGAGINMTHVQDIIVRNNLIYNNYAGGFTFYKDAGNSEQWSKRALIMGNTVYFKQFSSGRNVVNIAPTSEKVLIAGNILVSDGVGAVEQIDSDHLSTIASDYNVFWGIDETKMFEKKSVSTSLKNWQLATKNDRHSLVADPKFVDIVSADFSLDSTSKAVDAGMPMDSVRAVLGRLGGFDWILSRLDSIPDEDIRHVRRPVGAAPDVGAYERVILYDFNGDGILSVADAVALIILSFEKPEDSRLDVSGDGIYTIADVIQVLRLILQKS
jgi:parallel beta-helix repeat protein